MILWIILTLMVAFAVSGLTLALMRREGLGRAGATSTTILAAQLGDIDTQVAAGDVSAAEAKPLRNELLRRILSESHDPVQGERPVPAMGLPYLAIGIAGVVALAATALYGMLGRPDLAVNSQSSVQQSSVTSGHPGGDVSAMIAQLAAKMRENPNDAEGWRLLGWSYLSTGRPADAVGAYQRAVTLSPHNADYRSSEGEAMVRAAGGQVTPSALDAFRAAMKDDPTDPRSRYYLALYKDQTGDHDGAMADWVALIRHAPADAPWLPDVRRFVENVARERGLNLDGKLPPETVAPAEPGGPTAAEVQAANQMTAGQRDAMIHAMVDRLASELKANPHNVAGWEHLMKARMVLGDSAAATVAYRDSINAFANAPEIQARLRNSARVLGVPGS